MNNSKQFSIVSGTARQLIEEGGNSSLLYLVRKCNKSEKASPFNTITLCTSTKQDQRGAQPHQVWRAWSIHSQEEKSDCYMPRTQTLLRQNTYPHHFIHHLLIKQVLHTRHSSRCQGYTNKQTKIPHTHGTDILLCWKGIWDVRESLVGNVLAETKFLNCTSLLWC